MPVGDEEMVQAKRAGDVDTGMEREESTGQKAGSMAKRALSVMFPLPMAIAGLFGRKKRDKGTREATRPMPTRGA